MDDNHFQHATEIAKNVFEIIGFFFVGLYFLYRLLAGFFVPCRLAADITCDTPFKDKKLVRTVVKIRNKGEASIRIEEARLWVFKLKEDDPICVNVWPLPNSRDEPIPPQLELDTRRLDFQRLSFGRRGLRLCEAEEERRWINIEAAGEQQRQFLFPLPEGLYKVEFRIIGTPMFGRRFGFARDISYPLFHLSRSSQWVATAVIATGELAIQSLRSGEEEPAKTLRSGEEEPAKNGKT
jgi:hypothetical protein